VLYISPPATALGAFKKASWKTNTALSAQYLGKTSRQIKTTLPQTGTGRRSLSRKGHGLPAKRFGFPQTTMRGFVRSLTRQKIHAFVFGSARNRYAFLVICMTFRPPGFSGGLY
jgi:hypothetical protein